MKNPALLELDIEDSVEIENEQINYFRDVYDEEPVEISSSSDEANDERDQQLHMDDLSDSDEEFF